MDHHPAALHREPDHQAEAYARQQARITRPLDTRCGACDQPIESGQKTTTVDGERCHLRCEGEEL